MAGKLPGLLLVLAVLLLRPGTAAAATPESAITDELIAIHELCLSGKYEDVYKKTSALIKKKGCPPIVYVKRAEAWLSKRRVREAITDLDRALALNPQLKQAYEWRAECRKMSGDVPGAIKDMEQALALDPLGDTILLDLRPLYSKAGKSREEYRKVLKNNPLSRAIALETAKKNQEALAVYDAYIKSHPGNAFGYAYRGNLEYYLKDYKSALSDYQRSLSFNPSGGRELFFVANTLGALGRKQEAIAYYERMVRVSDNMGFRFKYAKALRDLGEPEKAIDQYSKIISLGKGNADAYRGRADCYRELGRYQLALADYTRAIEFDIDESPDTYKKRAMVYDKLGKKGLAAADRKKAARLSR